MIRNVDYADIVWWRDEDAEISASWGDRLQPGWRPSWDGWAGKRDLVENLMMKCDRCTDFDDVVDDKSVLIMLMWWCWTWWWKVEVVKKSILGSKTLFLGVFRGVEKRAFFDVFRKIMIGTIWSVFSCFSGACSPPVRGPIGQKRCFLTFFDVFWGYWKSAVFWVFFEVLKKCVFWWLKCVDWWKLMMKSVKNRVFRALRFFERSGGGGLVFGTFCSRTTS